MLQASLLQAGDNPVEAQPFMVWESSPSRVWQDDISMESLRPLSAIAYF